MNSNGFSVGTCSSNVFLLPSELADRILAILVSERCCRILLWKAPEKFASVYSGLDALLIVRNCQRTKRQPQKHTCRPNIVVPTPPTPWILKLPTYKIVDFTV